MKSSFGNFVGYMKCTKESEQPNCRLSAEEEHGEENRPRAGYLTGWERGVVVSISIECPS
jgi:hypothetical protein